jgi:phenylalanyl-tRNA synthetase beta chain
MRVSMKWLKELVDVDLPVGELTELLDMTGTKVEAVHAVGDALSGVVIGRILTKERHPEAEKLWVTTVDVGATEPLNIVCGAQNFEALDIVPVALVGTTLPNGMTIKKAKLRGVVSEGMNCSASELGLGGDSDGILVLPADAPVGAPFAQWRGLADTVLELEVTPNRPDCLSMAGVAREVGAVTDAAARMPGATPVESGAPAADSATVKIGDPALCPRYAARVITGVKIGPSPDWLAERVAAAGARPISNIVDITNYVMYELGQPLHAFDLDTLGRVGGKAAITVRVAGEGERLTTLDGQDRALAADTLLICDPGGPVALAGVMGGATTEVSDATVNVLLESACFQAASTGRTSRRLGLISEASQRFERGVDPNGCVAAIDRAAALIAEIAGGEVAPGIVDEYPVAIAPRALELDLDRLDAVVGEALAKVEVVGILERLGLSVALKGDRRLRVTVPTFRPDLEREIDLFEEVLRVHGMGRVPSTLPAGRGRVGGLTLAQRRRERIGATLRAAGLNEAITWSFGDSDDMARTRWSLGPGEVPVRLLNPMSREQSVMRWTTLPGLLRAVSANQRKGVPDVHLYEIGAVWWTAEGRKQPKERIVVAGVLAGRWERPAWHEVPAERERALGFFDGKGVVASIMEDLAIARWRVRDSDLAWLQPGRCAEALVGSDVAGWLGEVHPNVLESYECDGPVTVFELQMKPVLAAARDAGDFVDLPRFPAVKMDIALVVPDDVTAERVEDAITAAGRPLLESARLFDVYTGEGVPAGSRSLAFSLTYRDKERTLTDAEVAAAHERLLRKVIASVGGGLRS